MKRKRKKLFAACYQVAGELLLRDDLTPGQHARLTELLLDTLSRPHLWRARSIREKHRMALLP